MTDKRPTDDSRRCAGDVAAYALGALEPAEAQAFVRHLDGCPECRRELDAFAAVVADLGSCAPRIPVPSGLRNRVLEAVAAEPVADRRGGESDAADRARARHERAWWGIPRGLVVLGSAAALVVAAIVVAAIALTSGPSTRVIHAQVIGPGRAVLRVSDGHGELIVDRLAPPPSGKIYQVWLKRAHRAPTPTTALFGVTRQGQARVNVPGSLRGVSRVMVTPEPNGGSRAPTHAPVIIATLD
jgi:anti-sigma-K factor RskA